MQPRRLRFTPVPLKARHDGWNAARQRRFIEVLAATKSVTRACAAVGKSAATAYALRNRAGAESFAAAWDSALAFSPDRERRPSPRAEQRLRRLRSKAVKAEEVEEMHGPPNSPAPLTDSLSAFAGFGALLAELRGQDC